MLEPTEMLVTQARMVQAQLLALLVVRAMRGLTVTQVLPARMVQAQLLALLVVRVMLAQMVTQARALQTAMSAIPVTRGTRQLSVT
jgi:hypothetical protein